jgi:hypothetical protein
MKEETGKAMKAGSFKKEAIVEKKAKVLRPIGGGHAPWPLLHPLCVLRCEERF